MDEEDDIEAVVKVLEGDWLTQGPDIEDFEKAFAEYIGCKYAVAYNSGRQHCMGPCMPLVLEKEMKRLPLPSPLLLRQLCDVSWCETRFVGYFPRYILYRY